MKEAGIRKYKTCKICNSFDEDTFLDITLDIILRRKSWSEIKAFYSPLLPPGVSPLSDVCISFHKKHSDPAVYAEHLLKNKGEFLSKGNTISKVYLEVFKDKINQGKILEDLYKERISNLKHLQILLDEKKKTHESDSSLLAQSLENLKLLAEDLQNKKIIKAECDFLEKQTAQSRKDIFSMTKTVDGIQSDLQNILLKEKSIEKGLPTTNIHITQNTINVVQTRLQIFLEELIPYFLTNIFKDDPDTGKEVVKYVSEIMDKHLSPAFEEIKLLTPSITS